MKQFRLQGLFLHLEIEHDFSRVHPMTYDSKCYIKYIDVTIVEQDQVFYTHSYLSFNRSNMCNFFINTSDLLDGTYMKIGIKIDPKDNARRGRGTSLYKSIICL